MTKANISNAYFFQYIERQIIWRRAISLVFLVTLFVASNSVAQTPIQNQFKNVDLNLRDKVAQMLMIDIRYYCQKKAQSYCTEALTTLPPELAEAIQKSRIGGVILYTENMVSTEQIVQLNHQLQNAVLGKSSDVQRYSPNAKEAVPLYIGVDQEGGRVSRLPLSEYVPFLGNMALGASYPRYKTEFATQTAERTAKTLLNLGFNINFAPVLDVNNNPLNPIINVRAYSQSPQLVSELGSATIRAMQNSGLATAAKHFPGHGDTFIDSHFGLPRVEHNKATIYNVDLLPFRHAIANEDTMPDMIMTAHIQYPRLDNTPFVSNVPIEQSAHNKEIMNKAVLPATLSTKILTELLRDELAYKGLIITDALDMASISKFLNPTEAVMKSFAAGANITLMPYSISSPEDVSGFLDWLNTLTILISQSESLTEKVELSYKKIVKHKNQRSMAKYARLPLNEKLNKALAYDRQKDISLAQKISEASFTSIKTIKDSVLDRDSLLVIMPDKRRCQAFLNAYQKIYTLDNGNKSVNCISLLSQDLPLGLSRLDNIDYVLVGNVFPVPNYYESKEYEGISAKQRKDWSKQGAELSVLVQEAKSKGISTILLKLRSPYLSRQELDTFDAIYASYDYQVAEFIQLNEGIETTQLFAPTMDTLVKVLAGNIGAQGTLPVEALIH